MIYPVTMYSCKCDNCDKQYVMYENMVALDDESAMTLTVSEDADWHTEDDKHYCEECFEGWDDNDQIILKNLN